jgi:nucleoside-diphosphate-sugar epimerase
VSTDKMVADNILATRRLIEHAKGHRIGKVLFLSSLSVYGRIEAPVVDEKTQVLDPEPYGLSKLICERLLAEASGISGLAIRLPGVLGRNSVRNWLTGVLHAARDGREIVIYNPDAPFNNAVHVADLSRFVVELLRRDWQGFDAVTIGAAGHTTVRSAVKIIVGALGDQSAIREERFSRQSFSVSSERASRLYGYDPMEIEAMLRRFAAENAASNA